MTWWINKCKTLRILPDPYHALSNISYDFIMILHLFFPFIYLWLCWVLVATCRLSPVAVSGGYSLIVVQGLLIAVASLVVECRLYITSFSSCGSWALEHWLSSCGTWVSLPCGMWNLTRPRIKLMSPALAGRFLTTGPSGRSVFPFLNRRLTYRCISYFPTET